jgi:hypothetical protein
MAFGNINNPLTTLAPNVTNYSGGQGQGLFFLAQSLLKFTIVIAGLFTFWNLIQAGFMFLSAGGEAKNITKAWDKIWQSIVGLLIVAASFILAGVFGYLIFGDATALLKLQLFAP